MESTSYKFILLEKSFSFLRDFSHSNKALELLHLNKFHRFYYQTCYHCKRENLSILIICRSYRRSIHVAYRWN